MAEFLKEKINATSILVTLIIGSFGIFAYALSWVRDDIKTLRTEIRQDLKEIKRDIQSLHYNIAQLQTSLSKNNPYSLIPTSSAKNNRKPKGKFDKTIEEVADEVKKQTMYQLQKNPVNKKTIR